MTPPIPEQYEHLIKAAGDVIARWIYMPEKDVDGVCKLKDRSAFAGSIATTAVQVQDVFVMGERMTITCKKT